MSFSSILNSLLSADASPEPPSMSRAKDLLDLIASPTAIVTGVLLAFARKQLERNATSLDKPMTRWAFVASMAGLAIAGVVVAVMSPLMRDITFRNDGGVETRLLVYALTYLVAIGTAAYAGYVACKCVKDL